MSARSGYLNIILKEYAHGAEMFATAFASAILFGTPFGAFMVLSLVITAASVVMYGTAKEPAPRGASK